MRILFCIFINNQKLFAVSYFIFVGWIVDNLGAIVRYRAIGLPFFMGFFLFIVDWEKLRGKINGFLQLKNK